MSVFFGGIGVDRFLMRHIWQGILKLITFGGFEIWWIVDIILIATKQQFSDFDWEY